MSAAPVAADRGCGCPRRSADPSPRRQVPAFVAALLVLCAALLGIWATGHCSTTSTSDHLTGPIVGHAAHQVVTPVSSVSSATGDLGMSGAAGEDTPAGIVVRATTAETWLAAHDTDIKLAMMLGLLMAQLRAVRLRAGRSTASRAAPLMVMTLTSNPMVTAPRLSMLCITRT